MRAGERTPRGGGPGPLLQELTLLCFPFRSRPRTHITGSGVGCARASPRFPRSGAGAAGGPGEYWASWWGQPHPVPCSHLQGWWSLGSATASLNALLA